MTMKNASALLAGALIACSVAACGSGPQWLHPTMSDDQARVTAYNCQRDAQQLLSMSTSIFLVAVMQGNDCMKAHGFVRR